MADPRDALAQLADILADLYDGSGDVRRLVSALGLRPAMIQFDSRPVNTWHSVVRELKFSDKLGDLVDLALRDHPRHPGLLTAKAGALTAVRGPEPVWQPAAALEAIIGESDLYPVCFLSRGAEIARSVGRIRLADGSSGTGFLIGADVMITNHHVLRAAADAASARLELNAQVTHQGTDEPIHPVGLAPDRGFATDEACDWTAVRLAEPAGQAWGTIDVRDKPVAVGDAVYIIQHPGGGAKQVALGVNRVTFVGNGLVQYVTDTMPGSSGSPVFDRAWNLVALHHSGGWLREPGSKRPMFRNEGIAIDAVRAGLVAGGFLSS